MPGRRFSLADLMVLIAATAVGMALIRVHFTSMDAWVGSPSRTSTVFPNRLRLAAASPLLASWSLALLALQFRRPRDRFRRLVRTPGFAASYAAAFGIALWLVSIGLELIVRIVMANGSGPALFYYNNRLNSFVGPALAAVWISLASSGNWRRSPHQDWRETAGRVLGFAWLTLFVLCQFNLYFLG